MEKKSAQWKGMSAMIGVTLIVMTIAASLARPPEPSDPRIRGADISFTLQEEAIDQHLSVNGNIQPIENILASHGANYVRLRLWVGPESGQNDLESTLKLARRAHKAGLKLLLNLHYSDSWADRTVQQIPAAWQHQTRHELEQTVENYTREVVSALSDQGTAVDILQIGNEVTRGMLWPYGYVQPGHDEQWAGFVALLQAATRGARLGHSDAGPRIMIHTDTGGDSGASNYFFDNLEKHKFEFDVIGLTYYPFWNGSLATLEQNLHSLAGRYGKDIIIAETAYPWTLASGGGVAGVVSRPGELPELAAYPPTPHGQAKFFEALKQVLNAVPNGRGAGYFVWEPGWLPGVPAAWHTGNRHANLTLFDWGGQGLPALNVFTPVDPKQRRDN